MSLGVAVNLKLVYTIFYLRRCHHTNDIDIVDIVAIVS